MPEPTADYLMLSSLLLILPVLPMTFRLPGLLDLRPIPLVDFKPPSHLDFLLFHLLDLSPLPPLDSPTPSHQRPESSLPDAGLGISESREHRKDLPVRREVSVQTDPLGGLTHPEMCELARNDYIHR